MNSGNFLFRALIFMWMTLFLYSCNNKFNQKDFPTGNSIAFFDYFTYAGEGDYYKNNPLPDGTHFYNPILPGWYADPSICTDGENYFLVTSTFTYFPGVPLFHSPAISYNPPNQTYYMVTTNVGAGNFFVKTKDPFVSWSDPIYLPEVGGIDPSFFFDNDGCAYIVNNDGMDGEELYDGHRSIRIREFDVETDKTIGPWKMLINGGVNLAEKPIWIEAPHMYNINGNLIS